MPASPRIILSVVGLAAGLCFGQTHPTANPTVWSALPPMPRASAGFAVLTGEKQIGVIGGTAWDGEAKQWLADVTALDPAKREWSRRDALRSPIAYPVVAGAFLLGGTDGLAALDSILRLAPPGASILAAPVPAGRLPGPLVYAAGAAIQGHAYVVGGSVDPADLSRSTDAAWRIDLASFSAQALPPYPAGALILAGATANADTLFVFGGARWQPDAKKVQNDNRAFAWSPGGTAWRPLAPMPRARRGIAACALDDNWIFLAGGYGDADANTDTDADADTNAGPRQPDTFTHDAYLYSVRDNRYHALAPLPYRAMGMGVARLGDELFLFGGEDRMKHRTDQAYVCRWRDLTDRNGRRVITPP